MLSPLSRLDFPLCPSPKLLLGSLTPPGSSKRLPGGPSVLLSCLPSPPCPSPVPPSQVRFYQSVTGRIHRSLPWVLTLLHNALGTLGTCERALPEPTVFSRENSHLSREGPISISNFILPFCSDCWCPVCLWTSLIL